jgi:hypothetical protein
MSSFDTSENCKLCYLKLGPNTLRLQSNNVTDTNILEYNYQHRIDNRYINLAHHGSVTNDQENKNQVVYNPFRAKVSQTSTSVTHDV